VILLPLNCLRLHQIRRLIRKVREAARGDLSTEWLIPLITRHHHAKGEVLFRLSDPGDSMHLILAGSVRILELDTRLGPGCLIGEMGVFGPSHRRTGTAVCETEVDIGSISAQQATQLYYQNPAFGFHLFRIVVQRVLENERRWRDPHLGVSTRGTELPAKTS
jgi:CRP-like cAMP-binding protein